MRIVHVPAVLALAMVAPLLHASSLCPAVGDATAGCDLVITVTNSGTTITAGPSYSLAGGTYDGSDDTLIGIVNKSSHALSSINLSSPTEDIFGFDSDGIDTYGVPGNSKDSSGYGGPDTYFTNITNNNMSGTVDFLKALAANGGNTYFSLEEALSPSDISTGPTGAAPEPSTFCLLGSGILGVAGALRRRFAR